MSSHNDEYTIKCWNDCEMGGCPGHKIKIEANNTSDYLAYYKDDMHTPDFGMDFDELGAFIQAVYKMRGWVEIEGIFKGLDVSPPSEVPKEKK